MSREANKLEVNMAFHTQGLKWTAHIKLLNPKNASLKNIGITFLIYEHLSLTPIMHLDNRSLVL